MGEELLERGTMAVECRIGVIDRAKGLDRLAERFVGRQIASEQPPDGEGVSRAGALATRMAVRDR